MRKLKGAVQMVANMLRRDGLPVRLEAADELLKAAAEAESQLTKRDNELATLRQKNANLNKALLKSLDFIDSYEYFTDNGLSVKRCPSENERDCFVDKRKKVSAQNG